MELIPSVEPNADKPFFTEEQKELIRLRTRELISRIVKSRVGIVVFLDRSGRPLEWMMRYGWREYGEGYDLPKIKFANIGREKKDIFDFAPPTSEEYANDYFDKVQKDLNSGNEYGGAILVVDDFPSSGFSTITARSLFEHYFPHASVQSYIFFRGVDEKVFPKPDSNMSWWGGPYFPWIEDKAYLVKEHHDRRSLVTEREDDPQRRKQGLIFKKSIEQIFTDK